MREDVLDCNRWYLELCGLHVMHCFDILVNILRSLIIASHARDGSFSSFQQSCNFLPQRKDQQTD